MKVGDYEVLIPEGIEDKDGYVAMKHYTQYRIKLINAGERDADAEVFIDGNRVGEWRIYSLTNGAIERPSHDSGRFTFYRLDSKEGSKIGLKSSSELGLIKVIFKPEIVRRTKRSMSIASEEEHFMPGRLDEGGTGLSGHSEQTFNTVAPLDSNPVEYVTIYLRLGSDDSDVRSLFPLSNPIPKPLNPDYIDPQDLPF